MEIFGYSQKRLSREGLLSLREVSFCGSAAELAAVGAFISNLASQIKEGAVKTDHVHFPAIGSTPQIIVLKPAPRSRNDMPPAVGNAVTTKHPKRPNQPRPTTGSGRGRG